MLRQLEPTGSSTSSLTLSPDEKELVALKYKGRKFAEMNREELKTQAYALMLRIHVITGWTIPAEEFLSNILEDQFRKKLVQDWYDLNPEEVEYAFRSRGYLVNDWGKAMNIVLMDKVLTPYLNDRYRASEMEREIRNKEKQPWDLRTSVDWRGQIEENYQHYICGSRFYQRDVHPFVYDQLVEDGFIGKGAYKVQFRKYQKRFLKDDGTCMRMAKNFFVQLLFRMAVKQKRLSIYGTAKG